MDEPNDVKRSAPATTSPSGSRPGTANATEPETEVLVVGAGPAGLVLAIDLARRGVDTVLVEQSDELFPGSRGKGLQPRCQEILDDLGVLEAIHAEGATYPPMRAWDGDRPGEEWQLVERAGPPAGAPYGDVWMLPQFRTQQLLYARLRELGGEVRFTTRLTGLTQDPDGVTAHLTTTADEGRHAAAAKLRARYLVGADGGRSGVRAALEVPMAGERVDPKPMLVADVLLAPGNGLDRGHWHAWPHAPGGGMSLCPLAGTELTQVLAQWEDETARPGTSPEAVRQLVADRTVLSAEDVAEVLWASRFEARVALADRFAQGRVFLVGDAAHIHPPAGGQGITTSVQDAYNLGWKLGAVLRQDADPALLDTYEQERRPAAAAILGLSSRLLRESAATADRGSTTPVQRAAETHQLDLEYRAGPLAHELRAHPAGTLRAGDRAPDARLTPTGDSRLFDALRGPHMTLLAVGGATPPTAEPLPSGPLGVRCRTAELSERHAIRAWGDEPALFLIRPDGHILAAAEREEQLRPHLPAAPTTV